MNTYNGAELDTKINDFLERKTARYPELRHRSQVKLRMHQERRSAAEWIHDSFTTPSMPIPLR